MVARENLEESVVRTGRDFPLGEIPVFRRDLPVFRPYLSCKFKKLGELLFIYLHFTNFQLKLA